MKNYRKYISESVIDPPHEKIPEDLWDKNLNLKKEVKEQILDIFYEWLKNLKIDKNKIKNIFIVGSMATYQYNDLSDIDVTIVLNLDEDRLKRIRKLLPNGSNLKNTLHPINYYILGEFNPASRETIYDVLESKWIKKPNKIDYRFFYKSAIEQAISWMRKISLDIDEFNRDWIEYKIYSSYLKNEELELDKKEIQQYIEMKKNEIKADYDTLIIDLHVIKKFRNEAFNDKDEEKEKIGIDSQLINNEQISDPNYSLNNLIYKLLEKFGYIQKLIKIKNEPEKEWEEVLNIKED